jgi:hypothetical protein
MDPSTFIEQFESMPKKIQMQILEYAQRILNKTSSKPSPKSFKFDWEGGLKDMKDSSVALQHKANEWR